MQARGATAVRSVSVRLGELSGVDPALFATAYDTFSPQSSCAGSRLELSRIKARWECGGCGKSIAAGERLQCAACGVPARLVEGDELVLDRVELEVP
jgi:hydrogenase nickel incorporation protein HypA/HybF